MSGSLIPSHIPIGSQVVALKYDHGPDSKQGTESSEPEDPRRRVLINTVAALVHEAGFIHIENRALEILMEVFESNLTELGRTTRCYAEAACRVEPTVGDFVMAMVEKGNPVDPVGLRTYARRHSRPTIATPQLLSTPRMPQILTAGKRKCLPAYIPDFFPSMPDPHTYIRTPTHKQPLTDYSAVREKMSQQKRDVERSLSKFYARTSACYYFFPDNKDLFPLMSPKQITYHSAIICRDQIFEEEQSLPPINLVKKEKEEDNSIRLLDDDESGNESGVSESQHTWELIDNPFLRPPRPPSPCKKLSLQK